MMMKKWYVDEVFVRDGCTGELVEVSAERIDIREGYPNRDEAYAILFGADGRYAFAWGTRYPYADVVPAQNVKDGESGIEWFETEAEARAAMEDAVVAMKWLKEAKGGYAG